ncbi:MAG: serpin family protein [bacterium]|nr:serpin family protein [bacterium]
MRAPLTNRAKAGNDLGFRLLSHLAAAEDAAGKNVFLSSFSIAIALAMTYNGADGEAKEALSAILGLDDSNLEELNEANAAFLAMQDGLDPKVTLAIANSIWVATGLTLAPEFVRRIGDHYAGKVANLDFSAPVEAARVINEWVAKQTRGKIANLLSPPTVLDAIVILVNAIYFKGVWTNQFDKRYTSESVFTCADGRRKRLPMMAQSGIWHYSETEMFQGIVLPYGERRVGMHVLLPKPDVSLGTFQEHLTSERWKEWPWHARPSEGDFVLPRFKARYKENLVEALVALGGKGFKGPAFPGMGVGDLRISAVIHEAVLEVNEEGAEAAAATAVVMTRGGPSLRFSMVVDRPFFCAICDQETGAILFMGWILDPE